MTFRGQDLGKLSKRELRQARTKIQMIFQDPISSLNPRRRVRDIVAEPLDIWERGTKPERAERVNEMLEAVGIDPDAAGDRRPLEFSGGQCQRISIARALMLDPDLLICDEPVSALDVSVQAQILNLLDDLKAQFGLTMVFIAHDLAVVKNVSDRVAVMYLGKLVEVAGVRRPLPVRRPSLHRGPAGLDPRARPRPPADSARPHRRAPVPAQSAVGMPVPHPVPVRPGALRRTGATAAGHRPRPSGGLPLSRWSPRSTPMQPAPTPLAMAMAMPAVAKDGVSSSVPVVGNSGRRRDATGAGSD